MIRKLIFIGLLAMFLLPSLSKAQGKSNQHKQKHEIKQNGPPPWAPAHGYRSKTRYVYFKDYNIYYDNQRGIYIYLRKGEWEFSASIPKSVKIGDLEAAVKIDIDLSTDHPEKFWEEHKKKYPKG